ncbi:MAG TPA: hypothetical protein VK211_28415 [Kamptonema sp.]|nr:hypothetical protein [Kamptonema sp.]
MGTLQASCRITAEVGQIDVWFEPAPTSEGNPEALGLLERLAETPSIFQLFCNLATPQ